MVCRISLISRALGVSFVILEAMADGATGCFPLIRNEKLYRPAWLICTQIKASPFFPDGICQPGQSRNKFIIMGTNVPGVAGQFVHRGISDADHTRSAFGPPCVKFNDLIRYFKCLCHAQVHGRHVDSVGNAQLIDFNGANRGSVIVAPYIKL